MRFHGKTEKATPATIKTPIDKTKNLRWAKRRIIQFDWSRHWKKKVVPHLGQPLVRLSVEVAMKACDPTWTWDDGPHAIGCGFMNSQRVIPGKLSWYQPWRRAHWISFFSYAIGVLNYPELDWQFISGDCHTVPVGSWNGEHKVVMDILHFKSHSAEDSIALAERMNPDEPQGKGWPEMFASYIEKVVPKLRKLAQRNVKSRKLIKGRRATKSGGKF
jgi:hypothetical protein